MNREYKAALSYVGLYFTGLFFLAIEKEDEFIRKSAAQAFVLGVTAVLFHNFLLLTPLIGEFFAILFDILFIILLVFLIVKTLKSIYFKIPIISELSEKYVVNWFK